MDVRMRFDEASGSSVRTVSDLRHVINPEGAYPVEEGRMDQLRRWNKESWTLLTKEHIINVSHCLADYLQRFRDQMAACKSYGELQSLEQFVKGHLIAVGDLVDHVSDKIMALEYRYCEDIMGELLSVKMRMIAVSCSFSESSKLDKQDDLLMEQTCTRIMRELDRSFPWEGLNIVNSVLKIKYDKKSLLSMLLVRKLLHAVLFMVPTCSRSKVSIVAKYVAFCKYKKFIPSRDHEAVTKSFRESHDMMQSGVEELPMMKSVLGSSVHQVDNVVEEYFAWLAQESQAIEERIVSFVKQPEDEVIDVDADDTIKTEVIETENEAVLEQEEAQNECHRDDQTAKYTFSGYETPPMQLDEKNFDIEASKTATMIHTAVLPTDVDPVEVKPQFSFVNHEAFRLAMSCKLPDYSSNIAVKVPEIAHKKGVLDMDIEGAFKKVNGMLEKHKTRVEVLRNEAKETEKVEARLPLKKRRRATFLEDEDPSSRDSSVETAGNPPNFRHVTETQHR